MLRVGGVWCSVHEDLYLPPGFQKIPDYTKSWQIAYLIGQPYTAENFIGSRGIVKSEHKTSKTRYFTWFCMVEVFSSFGNTKYNW
jgi:hypothetical protein